MNTLSFIDAKNTIQQQREWHAKLMGQLKIVVFWLLLMRYEKHSQQKLSNELG